MPNTPLGNTAVIIQWQPIWYSYAVKLTSFFEGNGLNLLNFEQSGQGEPVIVLHGLFGSLDNLKMISRPLAEHFAVVNADLPDHGQSFRSEHFSYQNYAQSVLDLADHLGLERFCLLGHSMGGKVAMQLALTHPQRVAKLVVADIAPVAYPRRHDAIFQGLQSVKLDSISSRRDAEHQMSAHINEPGVRQFLLKSLTQTDNGWAWMFNLPLLINDYEQILGSPMSDLKRKYEGKTLFIKGADSDYILPEYRSAIEKLFPTAKARIMADCGHWLHAQKPAEFSRVVSRHFDAS